MNIKQNIKKVAITGLGAAVALSFAFPAFAAPKNIPATAKGKPFTAVAGQFLPPGQLKKITEAAKHDAKEAAKDAKHDQEEIIKTQGKAFKDAIHTAQEAFNKAMKAAKDTYKQDQKAANTALVAAINAAGGNQAAINAAVTAYSNALMAALQKMLTARQAAISAFLAALQNLHTVNHAPIANAQNVTVAENGSLAITLTGSDQENTALTFVVVTAPAHGTLSGTAPNLTYTPNTNFSGSDSLAFKANDGILDSAVATISITVTGINQAPTANAQSVAVAEDSSLAITLSGSDPEAAALTFTVVTGPAHGILSGTGATRTYAPAANYNGADSFTFKVNDGSLDSAVATVSITVTAVNDAPVANSLNATTTLNVALAATLTGSDVDGCSGQTFTYAVTSQPANGMVAPTSGVAVCSNGILTAGVTYTPTTGFTGSNAFSFKLNDGTVDSASATIAVAVNP